ncbi:CpaD family pilus assembly protein [Sphingomonas sp. Leaf17]|uniref:CpaD family pilus assembly protein n=1 Tax=Sphingomonas sp. Leaf17 TaxID=1735683 RepID=UPI000AC43BEF|nr:CpaD family pilus assembly protein [Sphingomonas sp. Leaf17]
MTRTPLSRSRLAALLVPALLLGGCMGTENRGLESVHQPVVSRADFTFDVATAGDTLAPGEAARLSGWFDAVKVRYGDRITIDDPVSDGTPDARSGVRGDVARIAGARGLLLSATPAISGTPVAPGTVRVIVSRMRADVPGCPDWSRDTSNEFESNTSSNHGCAINSNLAAMIANPEDLVRGRTGTETFDPAASTKAIDIFRKAAPSGAGGLKAESAGGK